MANDLSPSEKSQLTSGGACDIHTHRVDLVEHRHVASLQQIERIRKVTSNYAVLYEDDIIIADTTSGNITITIPPARNGKRFQVVKLVAANNLVLQFSNGETLLGSSTATVTLTALGATQNLKSYTGMYLPL